jgi:2-oxoglutarate ferredoxin oxidoreductase subunit alpha
VTIGGCHAACVEAMDVLAREGIAMDYMRVRGFPFGDEVSAFLDAHDINFVVEQNRDAQLRTLITTEQEVNPAKLEPILHYDGTPITARFITAAIAKHVEAHKVAPIKKGQAA